MRNLTSPQSSPHGIVQQQSDSSSSQNQNPFENEGSTGSDSSSYDGVPVQGASASYHPVPSDDSVYNTHIPRASPPRIINPSSAGNSFSSDSNSDVASNPQYQSFRTGPTNAASYYNSSPTRNDDLLTNPTQQLSHNHPNYIENQDISPSDNSITAHTTVGAAAAAAGHTPVSHLNNNLYSADNNPGNNTENTLRLPSPNPSHNDSLTVPKQNFSSQQYPAYSGIVSSSALSTAAAERAAAMAAGVAGSLLAPPSSRPSNTSLNGLSAANNGGPGAVNAMSSAEFDRYPNRISSAAPSIVSGSGAPLIARDGYHHNANGIRSSTLSDASAASSFSDTDSTAYAAGTVSPFVINSDFSPFGGYPASVFPLHMEEKEADDYLHNPDPILDAKYDKRCQGLDKRGIAALIGFIALILGCICVFVVVPALTFTGATETRRVITQTVEVLSTFEYNILGAIRTSLVDPDTPASAKSYTAMDGSSWTLVFSDEFNKEGRTFYEGEDQFWTAPDMHYAATQDLEWYSPDAVITANGTLTLRLDAFKNHNLYYRSGMVQSWNKMCFTQGRIDVSAQLAGNGSVLGLWPGIWTLGNLVRAGYLASAEGVWPYSYNVCDAGITPNQSSTDGISYLKGQRLNKCTCPGDDHPNPGTGRGAQEIDALEGTVDSTLKVGIASQSLQLAPYDIWYYPDLNFIEVYNTSVSTLNTWNGGPLQQAVSMASTLNTTWYELSDTPHYQRFGFEYLNDDTDGYIRWFIGEKPVFTIFAPALGPNGNVGQRQISKEPMSIILNLGISTAWVYIDWPSLVWPSTMRIDYVRIYQPPRSINLGCDPPGYPTYDYIQKHLDLYTNPNLTIWDHTDYAWPGNTLVGCNK